MSALALHSFRVWVQRPDEGIHYIEVPAPCFDSAHAEAAPLMGPGERVFCIDQLTGV